MTANIIYRGAFFFLLAFLANEVDASPLPADSAYCDTTLWPHVYHNYRLIINTACMSATGIIDGTPYSEADGDYHIRLRLDSPYTYMLNAANVSSEYGDLVCEPICVAAISQSDAVVPCQGVINNVYLPNAGEHVKVTGPYVTDNAHGWNEIHPVTSIEIIHPAAVNAVSAENLTVKTYPNPADDFINFQLSDYPDAPVQIILSDALGRAAGQYQMLNTLKLMVNIDWFPAGMYYYTILQKGALVKSGSFAIAH